MLIKNQVSVKKVLNVEKIIVTNQFDTGKAHE